MHVFEGFLGGILVATIAIIVSEIVLNYGLGDFLKDFFVGLFTKGKSFVQVRIARLEAKAAALRAKL